MASNINKNKKLNVNKCLEEYKTLKGLYKDFSITVKHLLENLLKEHDFKHQPISCREKNEQSLKNKLQNSQSFKSVKCIDDLAGCRIIFYLNDSVERVIQYLRDEFEVVNQKLKYSDNGYKAVHLIVKLKKDRLQLTEYKRFDSLKCEIQLTTVLFHAWSEMAHDIIYKPEKSLSEFDKRAFRSIENRFINTMKNHVQEAQYNFDFIAKDMKRIKQGKKIFDHSFLDSLSKAETNNKIHEKLYSLSQYIREFGDKTPKELGIINIINDTLKKSKKLKKIPEKHLWGDSSGMGYSDVGIICLEILDCLKFVYSKEVFKTLSELSIDTSSRIRKESLDIVSKMAKPIFIPKQGKIYYHLQLFILNEVEKWSNKKLMSHLNFILKITGEFLSPDFEGESWKDSDTLVFHKEVLPADDTVKKIRERTISILKKMYLLSQAVLEKQQILKILQKATHNPLHGDFTPELKKIILNNTNFVISFYISVVKKEDPEIIQIFEEQSYWLPKRFKKGLKGLSKLKSIINANEEYKIYKVLVGYGYHCFDESSVEMIEKERNKEMDEYIKKITQKNFNQWKKRMLSIVKNYECINNTIGFHGFRDFLYKLGEKKPQIAKKLISENEKELESILIYLVSGIWKSSQKEHAKKILKKWIETGKNLPDCGLIFYYVKEIDASLLEKVYRKAKGRNDTDAFINIIKSIAINFEHSQIGKNIFVGCFKELEKHKNHSGISHIFYKGDAILQTLTKNDWLVVLKNLLYVSSINYQLEKVLSIVAEKYLKELINFFFERAKIQKEKGMLSGYQAIPMQLHHLADPLNEKAELVIKEILKWFQKNKVYHWEGGHFLQAIFPGFHEELEDQLIKMIRSKDQTKRKIVLNVLRSYKYKNGTFLHSTCKEFIKQYPRECETDMFLVLSQMGIVSGEHGFVKGYERKKEEIQEWKKDKNKVIREFAEKYEKYLLERIDYEKKRADESIAMRKRKFEN